MALTVTIPVGIFGCGVPLGKYNFSETTASAPVFSGMVTIAPLIRMFVSEGIATANGDLKTNLSLFLAAVPDFKATVKRSSQTDCPRLFPQHSPLVMHPTPSALHFSALKNFPTVDSFTSILNAFTTPGFSTAMVALFACVLVWTGFLNVPLSLRPSLTKLSILCGLISPTPIWPSGFNSWDTITATSHRSLGMRGLHGVFWQMPVAPVVPQQ